MLHLVYGSSLSVKEEILFEQILQSAGEDLAKNYIFIVPEQMSMTVQDALVRRAKDHVLNNIDVLTFNRLAYHVFTEMNDPEKNVLDDNGKLMLLRLVTVRVQKELKLLKTNLNRPGFLDELKSLISELVQYNITPELLQQEIDAMKDQPALKLKLQDIRVIYSAFKEMIHNNYRIAEERLQHLAQLLPNYERARRTVFVFMGFTGFTPPQYDVIRELLKQSPDMYCLLSVGSEYEQALKEGTFDTDKVTETDLFYMPFHMASELKRLAIELSAPEKGYDEIYISEEVEKTAEVRALERNIYRTRFRVQEKVPENIRLLRTRNRKSEVQTVLSEVLKDVRRGFLFSDIAVISGSVDTYRDEIEEQFTAAGVPYFMDSSRSIEHDPLFMLVRDILEIERKNYAFDEVVSYMKNPLLIQWLSDVFDEDDDNLSPYERVSEVENYIRAAGIRGKKRYREDWERKSRRTGELRIKYINETKFQLMEPLLPLLDALADKEKTVSEKLTEIVTFLEYINAYETMKLLRKEAEDSGEFLQKEYEKSYELLMQLFERIAGTLGEEKLPPDEFREVMAAGISAQKLTIVPPTRNRLVVGDLMRSRISNIKKLYILGANEEILLANPKDGGLLSDLDREYLKERKLTLSETAKQSIFNRRYYIYLLLTRPSQSITMTYASAGMDGKGLEAAALVESLKSIFTGLKEEWVRDDDPALLSSFNQVRENLAGALREEKEYSEELLRSGKLPEEASPVTRGLYLLTLEKDFQEADALVSAACFSYKKPKISEEMALRAFGEVVSGSTSRLELFAGCAYRHFLNYGLGLAEQEVYRLSDRDYGTIYHDSIEDFFKQVQAQRKKFEALSDSELTHFVDTAVQKVAEDYGNEILNDSARNQYLIKRVKRLTLRTLWALRYQWEQGGFTDTLSEQRFDGGKSLPELSFMLENGRVLNLTGRIDRMDMAEADDRIYVRIIDYKSGSRDLNYTKIYYGIQLQLLVYMEGARALLHAKYPDREILPAGIYYYHIDDPVIEDEGNTDIQKKQLDKLRLKGITNASDENLVLTDQIFDDGNTGNSTVVKSLQINKNGEFAKNAKVASSEDLEKVGAFALDKAKTLTEEMLHGEIGISPYEMKDETACTYCPYGSICHFDVRLPGFEAKTLKKKELKDLTGGESDGMD